MTTYNKVMFGEQTIMDISNDTVTADKVLAGITAHDGSGAAITGTIQSVNATTITPTTSAQTAVPAGKYTNGAITVAAIQTEEKTVTENGTVTPSSGKYLSSVIVNVPAGSTINNQNKTVTPTASQQTVTADSGYTGLGTVTVNAVPTEIKTITTNGTHTPTTGSYFSSVTVNVPSINISQDANGYIILDDENGYGGGGGYSLEDVIKHNYSGEIVYNGTDNIKNYTFSDSAITKLWLPNCKNLGGSAAENCRSLKILYIGGGTDAQIGTYAVRSCSALEQLRIPYMGEYRGFGGYALQGCTSLRLIDYGSCRTLAFNSLPACPLDTVIIRNTNAVVSLGANALNNSTAFQNGGTGGKVYVPSAFLAQYPTATNWSTYYGYGTMQFLALEGSPYEQPDFEVTL